MHRVLSLHPLYRDRSTLVGWRQEIQEDPAHGFSQPYLLRKIETLIYLPEEGNPSDTRFVFEIISLSFLRRNARDNEKQPPPHVNFSYRFRLLPHSCQLPL